MKELIKRVVKRLFAQRGLAIIRVCETSDKSSLGYISAKETISAAEPEGLSVCDYVEKCWNQSGDTQRVIDQIASCGVFETKQPCVLEIGAGTGRYLEKVLAKCQPAKYESYETAQDWAEWLQARYPIVSHEADGVSLRQTRAHSVDLLHAHGVFVYLPFLVSYRYWKEIWRVMKNGGFVVFDIMCEDYLDERTVEKWLISEHNYPCFLSKDYVVSLFGKHGFGLVKTFTNRYGEGRSLYLVFCSHDTAQQGSGASVRCRSQNLSGADQLDPIWGSRRPSSNTDRRRPRRAVGGLASVSSNPSSDLSSLSGIRSDSTLSDD
jgi:SAM-dependent methyltransferase